MEYILKEQILELTKQRKDLISSISEMNENLPNYGVKINDLNMQVDKIDMEISNYINIIKDVKMMEIQNDLTIKTQIK